HVVTDGAIASVDVGNPLRLVLHAYDTGEYDNSGLQRASAGTVATNMYIDVDLLLTNNIEDFLSDDSTVDTTAAGATNVWVVTNVISGATIQEMIDRDTNAVWAALRDADFDLPNDQLSVTQFFGYIRVEDDDAIGPTNSATPLQVMVDGTAVAVLEGTDTNTVFEILDGELANADSAPITFSFNAWDRSGLNRGLNSASTNMNVTIDGVTTNNVTNYNASASSSDTTVSSATSLWTWVTAFGYDTITDMYADGSSNHPVLANVIDADNDRDGDNLWGLTNRQFGMYRVTDDDVVAPITRTLDNAEATWGAGAGSKYMLVATNGTIVSDRASDASNVVYRVTDGYVANLSGGQTLQFVFGGRDAYSGISASQLGADTNEYMSFSIENGFSGQMSAFDAAESSPDAAGVVRTNVFTFDDGTVFTDPVISNLVMSAQSNAVWVTMPDSDNDRADDHTAIYSERVGYLYVQDDDNQDALFNSMRFFGKTSPTDGDVTNATFSITGLVADASGVYGTGGANEPLYALFSPTAEITADAAMDSETIIDGEGTVATPAPIGIENIPVAYADNALGVWTVRVTAVDYDNDGWAGDSRMVVSNIPFTVVDDDTSPPALTGVRIGSGTNGSGAAEVMFSEYIEVSSGNNKYLEIYNGTTETAIMSNYYLLMFNNGNTTVGWSNKLSGTLAPGGCYVIAHSSASGGWSGTPNATAVLSYDGNDAIVLMHGPTTVDVLGVVGNADVWGNEVTAVRDLDILNPSTTWVSNDWTYYSATYDYLGSHVGPISDGELAAASLSITGNVQDTYSGVYATGANQPVYSIYQPDGTELASGSTFDQKPAADGDARASTEPLSDSVSGLFTYDNIMLGVHTVSVTVVDYDHDRANDSLTVTNNVPMSVVDDDTNAPLVGASVAINLLRNASFETEGSDADNAYHWEWNVPDQFGGIWNNHLRKDWRARNGSWEATVPGQWGAHVDDSGGWFQMVTNVYAPGTVWQAGGWFYADDILTTDGQRISIQFFDTDTNRISGETNYFAHPGEEWTYVSLQATAPVGCAFAQWEAGAWGMNDQGALQFDDVSLGPIVDTPMAVQIGSSNVTATGSGTNAVFTVTDGDLAASRGVNLLTNEGFESNWDGWDYWDDLGVQSWAAESGSGGAFFRAWADGDSPPHEGGFFQELDSPVDGETYTFTIRGFKETNFWASLMHQKIEFLDGTYTIVSAVTNVIDCNSLPEAWQTHTISGVSPVATYLRAVVIFSGGTNDNAGTSSSFFMDNAALWAGD
ncbi:MAG: hypothetical protein EOM20_18605, partial [Spartobacteria bacterium]|nr:hypothetical protein [Spartobacteria bacterium]